MKVNYYRSRKLENPLPRKTDDEIEREKNIITFCVIGVFIAFCILVVWLYDDHPYSNINKVIESDQIDRQLNQLIDKERRKEFQPRGLRF